MAKLVNDTKVITGKVRASYVKVFKAESVGDSDEAKFSISLIIPKSDKETIAVIKKAIETAKEQGKAKLGGKIPSGLKTPLRDGDVDRSDDEAYANAYFINASSFKRPEVIDRDKNPITDESDFYSGCYCRASITFFAYNANGNKGIAAGLNHLQKISDGEPLGGRGSADTDFEDDIEDEDDDI